MWVGESFDWLRRCLPFVQGDPRAQTFRPMFRLIEPVTLERGFASWAASVHTARQTGHGASPEVIAIDRKTVRGSKTAPRYKQRPGTNSTRWDRRTPFGLGLLVLACASEAGLVRAQRNVDAKSNEMSVFCSC